MTRLKLAHNTKRKGGGVHKEAEDQIEEKMRSLSYHVTRSFPLGGDLEIDMVAEKDDHRI